MNILRKLKGNDGWTNERIAKVAFYALVAIAAVVFILFYTIGFNKRYSYDPNFNEPRLTFVLIFFVAAVILLALGVALWAIITTIMGRGKTEKVVNGIPAARISTTVAISTFVVLVLTFLIGSSEAVNVNGKAFDNAFQLRSADMFVLSSAVMLILAVAAVIYGAYHSYQVEKQ